LLRAAGRCLTKVRFWKIEKTITWLPVYFHRKKASVKAAVEKDRLKMSTFPLCRVQEKGFAGKSALGHSGEALSHPNRVLEHHVKNKI
jgi:hypothetical protein